MVENIIDELIKSSAMNTGDYDEAARLAQALKLAMRSGKNWEALPAPSKEALEVAATSIARFLASDVNESTLPIEENIRREVKRLNLNIPPKAS